MIRGTRYVIREQTTMNIYFAGSIRGGREDVHLYMRIIEELKKYGTVLTEFVGDPSISSYGTESLTDKQIHDQDVALISQSDIVVAEVTTPSLGVGYEIATAVHLKKPVICLYRGDEKRLSAMISGCGAVEVVTYATIEDLFPLFTTKFTHVDITV